MLQSTAVKFVNEAIAELKQVVWPTKEQLLRLTLIVISVSLITGLVVGGLDFIFAKMMTLIL